MCFNVSLKQNACLGFLRGFYAIYVNYLYAHYLVCYKLCLCLLLLSNFKVFKQHKLLISQLHMLQTVTCVTSLS